MESCYNCKHARDIFYSENSWDALFYCEAKEEIYLWNLYNHRCEKYESNLHANWTARQNTKARDKGMDQESGYPQMDNSEGDR